MTEQELVNAIPGLRSLVNVFRIAPEKRVGTMQSVHPGTRYFFDRFFRRQGIVSVEGEEGDYTLTTKTGAIFTLKKKSESFWLLSAEVPAFFEAFFISKGFNNIQEVVTDYELRVVGDDELSDVAVDLTETEEGLQVNILVNGQPLDLSLINGFDIEVSLLNKDVIDWRGASNAFAPVGDSLRFESYRNIVITQGGTSSVLEGEDSVSVVYDPSFKYNMVQVAITKKLGNAKSSTTFQSQFTIK
jgi:hypothetical protein